ncbi:MAG: mevalonate kinase [Polyangiales bacterium]
MNAAQLTGQGFGKVILLGEHSVVYGRPALAAGLARGCTARAAVAESDSLSVEPWGVTVHAAREESDADRELLRRGFLALCERCRPERPGLAVSANMEIPGGAGLGGSAALSVAVIRAMDDALGTPRSDEDALAASLAWERVFHGNPSGIDSAMALGGGLQLYSRGQTGPSLQPVRASRGLHLVIGNSAEHGSTKAMVASVAWQHAQDSAKAEQIFDAIAALVLDAKSALEAGDHVRLGELMNANQTWLDALRLSTERLDRMCGLAREAGALGAKLTGGGGGGCMIALARDAAATESIVRALSDAGYQAFGVEVRA